MRIAVLQFPGSNCDQDCLRAFREGLGAEADYLWHKNTSLSGFDGIVIPGGFSYGDYLRCGAIARFSPVMKPVIEAAGAGMPVIGICNGFQILCEAGLLPGALLRNRTLHFVCKMSLLRLETEGTPFTARLRKGQILRLPIAHGEGAYYANETILADIEAHDQVIFRYVDAFGKVTDQANPNGSLHNIAGICNEKRNILGMMPHPDRAWDQRIGSVDGISIFRSMLETAVALR
ncbi:MAG: phosphoribosylformylglycinamidine synthase subunit PurQ [Verrucomicrobia bacterium]|nr:phosphoribosylformylglycinamidine synthase subunit PurQ [Verrucomicrobiota bacterium]